MLQQSHGCDRSEISDTAVIAQPAANTLHVSPQNLPFADIPLFKATCVDQAHEHIARLVNPHRISVLKEAKKLAVNFSGIREDSINFLLIEYGAEVHVRPEDSGDYFYVQTTVAGCSAVFKDNRQINVPENNTVVVSPDRPYGMRINSGTKRLVVGIGTNALEQHLAKLCGRALDRPLRFHNEPHSLEATRIWFTQIYNLYSLFKINPVSYQNEICRRHHYDATCTLALNLFSHNHTEALSTNSVDPSPRRCRAAMEFMRERANQKLTITDVAKHVGLSVRTLQLSFQRYYNMTPTEALRNLRLDAVKATLENSDPSINVTSVLLDHGVSSFGHFAAQFRNRFGVTPGEVQWARRRGQRGGSKPGIARRPPSGQRP
jgi:AraC-like DNA-binding protein